VGAVRGEAGAAAAGAGEAEASAPSFQTNHQKSPQPNLSLSPFRKQRPPFKQSPTFQFLPSTTADPIDRNPPWQARLKK
jgi:hypothetical protein